MSHFAGNNHWAEPSPLFTHRARLTPLKCKIEYLVLALRKETAVQTGVGTIVWAFRRLRKSRSREMSARGYAHPSVRPELCFFHMFGDFGRFVVHVFLFRLLRLQALLHRTCRLVYRSPRTRRPSPSVFDIARKRRISTASNSSSSTSSFVSGYRAVVGFGLPVTPDHAFLLVSLT